MVDLTPLVSVIMPFRDTPLSFMKEAVDSVIGQTYENLELLLVNDGSEMGSTVAALQLAAAHPLKIRYLEHEGREKRGASASRQLAIHQSKGSLIAFLDADDVWLPNKLDEQVAILMSQPLAGMVYGNTLYWYSWTGDPRDRGRDFFPPLGISPNTLIQPPALLALYLEGKAAVPCTCSVLIRKKVLDFCGGFESSFHSLYTDQVLYAKVCLATPVYVVETCWDRYRKYRDSSTGIAQMTGQIIEARRQFLAWLGGYLDRVGCEHEQLRRTLRREQWLLEAPDWLTRRPQIVPYVRWAKKWLLRAGLVPE